VLSAGAEAGEVNSLLHSSPQKLEEAGLQQTQLGGYSLRWLDVQHREMKLGYGRVKAAQAQLFEEVSPFPTPGLSGDAGAAGS